MMARAIVTIYSVKEDGLSGDTQTVSVKVGEEIKIANPLKTNISAIVIDRVEED